MTRFSVRQLALAALTLTLIAWPGVQARAGGLRDGGPDLAAGTRSLSDLIDQSGARPVHVIFVHGMRAEGPGASARFRQGLCKNLPELCGPGQGGLQRGRRLDIGPWPEGAGVVGRQIWRTSAEWDASRPFVDRYVYSGAGHTVVVDEVNWWPALFPLKCRMILAPETRLSGPDRDHLRLCARNDGLYYPWLSASAVADALAERPVSGGGVWANAALKQQIMNWGLTDAVITLGPMRTYFRRTMDAAFDEAADFSGTARDDQTFVVISESLGSFVVMDSFARGDGGVRRVVSRTYDLYFFANQFALLELARVSGMEEPERSGGSSGSPASNDDRSAGGLLQQWATPPTGAIIAPGMDGPPRPPRQIVAFNDPSDILTFDVPQIEGAVVVNLYDQNGFGWFGLFENPIAAHTGHSANPAVLQFMFRRSPPRPR